MEEGMVLKPKCKQILVKMSLFPPTLVFSGWDSEMSSILPYPPHATLTSRPQRDQESSQPDKPLTTF